MNSYDLRDIAGALSKLADAANIAAKAYAKSVEQNPVVINVNVDGDNTLDTPRRVEAAVKAALKQYSRVQDR